MPLTIPVTLSQEVQICIDHGVGSTEAHKEIQMSNSYIRINGQPITQYKIMEIDSLSFEQLYNIAYGYRSGGPVKFLTAVKVFFAVDSANILTVLFKPIYLEMIDDFYDVQNNRIGQFNRIVESADYYKYNEATKSFNNNGDPNWLTNYKNVFEIKRIGTNYEKHNALQGVTGVGADVVALTFTFQEIYKLIGDNSLSPVVKVFNAVREVVLDQTSGISTVARKHNLLLGPSHLIDPVVPAEMIKSMQFEAYMASPLVNMYSNLSHMCPPSCNTNFVMRLLHSPVAF